MAQNDSMAANTAMIQEVLKRMGIQGVSHWILPRGLLRRSSRKP